MRPVPLIARTRFKTIFKTFCCIHAPDFPVQALVRAESGLSLGRDPIAILDGPASMQVVAFCNERARDEGVVVGMTKRQAEVLPTLMLRKRSLERERVAQLVLIDCCFSFSPHVESTCPGTVIVDISRAERLFGNPINIAQRLAARVAEAGIHVNVALAPNADAALHAARGCSGTTIIEAGQESVKLAHLPIEVLQPDTEALETLHNWGVHNLKSLANLPQMAVVQRLGQKGLHLQQLARGETDRELVPAEPATRFQDSIEFEESQQLIEPIAFVLNRLLTQLMWHLKLRALATDQVQLDLKLEVHSDRQRQCISSGSTNKPVHQRTLKLPVPTQDEKLILKLLQLDLASHLPQAPVKKITIEAMPAEIRFGQTDFFRSRAVDCAKLEIGMAKLRAVVGEKDDYGRNRVGFVVLGDSHEPETFEVLPFVPSIERCGNQGRRIWLRNALRRCRPQKAVNVEVKDNIPSAIVVRGRKKSIVHPSGPWHSTGLWWHKADDWSREVWNLEISPSSSRGCYRIVRESHSLLWFLDGMYD